MPGVDTIPMFETLFEAEARRRAAWRRDAAAGAVAAGVVTLAAYGLAQSSAVGPDVRASADRPTVSAPSTASSDPGRSTPVAGRTTARPAAAPRRAAGAGPPTSASRATPAAPAPDLGADPPPASARADAPGAEVAPRGAAAGATTATARGRDDGATAGGATAGGATRRTRSGPLADSPEQPGTGALVERTELALESTGDSGSVAVEQLPSDASPAEQPLAGRPLAGRPLAEPAPSEAPPDRAPAATGRAGTGAPAATAGGAGRGNGGPTWRVTARGPGTHRLELAAIDVRDSAGRVDTLARRPIGVVDLRVEPTPPASDAPTSAWQRAAQSPLAWGAACLASFLAGALYGRRRVPPSPRDDPDAVDVGVEGRL